MGLQCYMQFQNFTTTHTTVHNHEPRGPSLAGYLNSNKQGTEDTKPNSIDTLITDGNPLITLPIPFDNYRRILSERSSLRAEAVHLILHLYHLILLQFRSRPYFISRRLIERLDESAGGAMVILIHTTVRGKERYVS